MIVMLYMTLGATWGFRQQVDLIVRLREVNNTLMFYRIRTLIHGDMLTAGI